MLLGPPPSVMPPDMIWPIIRCMFGSDNMDVAMFISIGLLSRPPMSKPLGAKPGAMAG
jgi:hypothetical protein